MVDYSPAGKTKFKRSKIMKRTNTRAMVECALMIALGTVLAQIKIWQMPYGGSVTLVSSLPFILISYRHGIKWGLGAGLANGTTHQHKNLDIFSALGALDFRQPGRSLPLLATSDEHNSPYSPGAWLVSMVATIFSKPGLFIWVAFSPSRRTRFCPLSEAIQVGSSPVLLGLPLRTKLQR